MTDSVFLNPMCKPPPELRSGKKKKRVRLMSPSAGGLGVSWSESRKLPSDLRVDDRMIGACSILCLVLAGGVGPNGASPWSLDARLSNPVVKFLPTIPTPPIFFFSSCVPQIM